MFVRDGLQNDGAWSCVTESRFKVSNGFEGVSGVMKTKALAYITNSGVIDVATIGDTRRAVMVNALYTQARIRVTIYFSEDEIKEAFKNNLSEKGDICDVVVTAETH